MNNPSSNNDDPDLRVISSEHKDMQAILHNEFKQLGIENSLGTVQVVDVLENAGDSRMQVVHCEITFPIPNQSERFVGVIIRPRRWVNSLIPASALVADFDDISALDRPGGFVAQEPSTPPLFRGMSKEASRLRVDWEEGRNPIVRTHTMFKTASPVFAALTEELNDLDHELTKRRRPTIHTRKRIITALTEILHATVGRRTPPPTE